MRLALIPLTLLCLSAADRPNFSGNWKMDAEKSSFGQLPRPVEYERKIDHKEPVILMTVRQAGPMGEQTVDLTLRTDGRETSNKSRTGEAKTTGRWLGRDLQLTTTREVEGGEAVTRETWSLSEDGKTLTSVTQMKTPRGAFEIKMVLRRATTP
jgi:hypothetical protein